VPVTAAAPETGTGADRGRFVHTAVCHHTDDEFVGAVLPFVAEGLGRNDAVYVNLAPMRLEALRTALGRDEARVWWSDTRQWHPHPSQRLRAIRELVDAACSDGPRPLRFVGECAWAEGPAELTYEWERFEAVLNHALGDAPVTMVCVYDAATLPAGVLERVASTHPLLGAGPFHPSPAFLGAEPFLARHAHGPLSVPDDAWRSGARVTPTEARGRVRSLLLAGTLSPEVLDDIAVIVTELVTNAWAAGASAVECFCWHDADWVSVQIDDDGPGLADPLAGYRRPTSGVEEGRGLWIARQLADLVQIECRPDGTSVRARLERWRNATVSGTADAPQAAKRPKAAC
jgi:anti-sigma regulatory factor (Ser/Thr protein kinase)